MNKHRTPHEAYWGLVAQGIGFILIGLVFLLANIVDILVDIQRVGVLSFGLGFLVCLLPNFVFYLLFFRYQGAQYLQTIKNRFYIGEAVKLLLTAAMFAFVWQIAWVEAGKVFLGYMMSLLCFFSAPIAISIVKYKSYMVRAE